MVDIRGHEEIKTVMRYSNELPWHVLELIEGEWVHHSEHRMWASAAWCVMAEMNQKPAMIVQAVSTHWKGVEQANGIR